MPDTYVECQVCKYRFPEPDPDAGGVRIKCPICGSLARNYHLSVGAGVLTMSGSAGSFVVSANEQPEIEASFDIERQYDGRSIIDCSGAVDQRIVEYFHKHPRDLTTMNRRAFEELVAELFKGFGYSVEVTQRTRDGGRDIIAVRMTEVNVRYLIECKRPDPGNIVGVQPVRQLLGVIVDEQATKGILATTARFSRDAVILYERHKWELELKEYNGLLEWIRLYLQAKGKDV